MTPRRTFELRTAADQAAVAAAVAALLRTGEVGIVPTETVYGLVCACRQPAALERLQQIKGREPGKPFQMLIADFADLAAQGLAPDARQERVLRACWPGGLTAVLPDRDGRQLGLRLPADEFLRALIRGVGGPLWATSANPAGGDPAHSLACGFADLPGPPDFAVLAGPPAGLASTVVRLCGPQPEILREGAIPAAAIRRFWQES